MPGSKGGPSSGLTWVLPLFLRAFDAVAYPVLRLPLPASNLRSNRGRVQRLRWDNLLCHYRGAGPFQVPDAPNAVDHAAESARLGVMDAAIYMVPPLALA